MRVAVNTRFLIKDKLEGLGWFTYEVLKRMVEKHPEAEFVFLFDRPFDSSFIFAKNVKGIVVGPPARHPFLWYWWFEVSLPKVLRKINPTVFFSPDSYLSLKSKVPTLLVVHDLAFEHYPKDTGKLVRKYYQKYMPKFCKRAERVATVSAYTKQDVIEQYNIDPGKIDVTHNGVRSRFSPIDHPLKRDVQLKWTKGAKYFVYVGSIHPRKNIARLFEAFDAFKKETESEWKLVMVGRKAWQSEEIFHTYEQMGHKEDVVFTDRLSELDLNNVLAGAEALCYVPYFEGFGLPILEAQQCEVPVITSNVTSMPEVAGDSCLLVDPFSVTSIKEGMLKLYQVPSLRTELIEKGKVNCTRFSWDKTADKLWDALLKLKHA